MFDDPLFAIAGIAFVAGWSPGPNNTLLAASGANFGLRRTGPHVAGVAIGFAVMLFAVALGLGEVLKRAPVITEVMRGAGALLLLWFAWRIATATGAGKAGGGARPFTFLQAAGFQWINPKAWAMSIGLITQYDVPGSPLGNAARLAGVALLVAGGASLVWAGLGAALQRLLQTPGRLRAFNLMMAGLILLFVVALLSDWA
ncbi:LysE family translocator [Paroceanicella profunda]|uniref:LysE family translocator n=1 Tax=Paroceanicella profunda TaxID=2579971 RepID=A0A5B8FHH1_9RHOB|nr:LysE family translocator [Paroceanicella profunda]QDL91998.1 LysE family translocator [Paroceanicella profunda]